MVLAGIAFAIVNALTFVITSQLGFKPQSDAFWQYLIALALSAPFLVKYGLAGLRTDHPMPHIARAILSALGVQAFVTSFSYGLATWHVVALTMTAPFFVLIGAGLFLRELVPWQRWAASAAGFAGAILVANPFASGFSLGWLLPILAALLWGASSLITKYLTRDEKPETLTVWLLLLLTPINAALSVNAGFEIPRGTILWLVLAAGVLVFCAQYLLTKSYAAADANFVQPFDDLKLISNVLVFGLAFKYWPDGYVLLGLGLILGASLFLLWSEKTDSTKGITSTAT
jgi:drug/metabolite transporter (DMT)-like permease